MLIRQPYFLDIICYLPRQNKNRTDGVLSSHAFNLCRHLLSHYQSNNFLSGNVLQNAQRNIQRSLEMWRPRWLQFRLRRRTFSGWSWSRSSSSTTYLSTHLHQVSQHRRPAAAAGRPGNADQPSPSNTTISNIHLSSVSHTPSSSHRDMRLVDRD